MLARLGFAVAYHMDPDVLLIDEVLGVGDSHFRQKSSNAIKARLRSNRTVVLVSHNVESILELCDRVVWMEQGRTLEEGPPQLILDKYQDRINLGKGKIRKKDIHKTVFRQN
jgi:lipopolysaccharide transport system ATP-binding protein